MHGHSRLDIERGELNVERRVPTSDLPRSDIGNPSVTWGGSGVGLLLPHVPERRFVDR
jgi:hypothetical protein